MSEWGKLTPNIAGKAMDKKELKRRTGQTLDPKAECSHCKEVGVLRCNVFIGGMVNGKECGVSICPACAHVRLGIVYCWEHSEQYR